MMEKKFPKIVFAFVEAGMGHIMPMQAVYDAFVKKYGDKCEVVKTYFFQDKNNPDMKYVEDEFIKEVKLHNAKKGRGTFQFALMGLFGSKASMKYLMGKRYFKGFLPSLNYLQELKPDLIFNTHFSTLYYSCEAKEKGLISPVIAAYCPDPVIGKQWDNRLDLIGISSSVGKEKAEKTRFKKGQVVEIPFLIRQTVKEYNKGKEHYRRELNIPEDNFTILLADGAYGAGKLRQTVLELLKIKQKITVIAVCGKNEKLYEEFRNIKAPKNICFLPFGFTDKMLMLSACCDLFVGKAGASNIAESCYFGAPQIITFCATPIEKWIAKHYTDYVKSAVKITNVKKAVKKIEEWISAPQKMEEYKKACLSQQRTDGPDIMADILWDKLNK
jgi:UDP-N-acetylglucosamine:LPS N-acetylglucosamine transferase